MRNSGAAPFVKWADGKRQLLAQIRERMSERYNRYHGPFIGGGAVLFELQPENATTNDIDKALISTYKRIQSEPFEFLKFIDCLDEEMWEDEKEYFYLLREHYNDKMTKEGFNVEMAALFAFLDKHCFNGLYRANGKGLSSVSYNNSRRKSVNEGSIRAVSDYPKSVDVMEGDFEKAYENAGEGDFVFIDSPYALLNPISFESYTKEGFDVESHKWLANLFDKLTVRGCYCMLTNHNTEFINKSYGNKGYRTDAVSVKRFINADAPKRVGEEAIIYNY